MSEITDIIDEVVEDYVAVLRELLDDYGLPYGEEEQSRPALRDAFNRIKDDPAAMEAFIAEYQKLGFSEEQIIAHLSREADLAMRRERGT